MEQHGDDFLVCGITSNLEVLADEFKKHFLVKRAEIACEPEHQNEIHFLKRTNHCKSMVTPGSKGQESSRIVADSTEKLDPQEHREFRPGAGICQCMAEKRFDICLQYEGNHERGSRTEPTDDIIHVTVDADLAGDPKTRCSTSGPCFTVRHWSVTQAAVSLSSAESQAKAITKGCIEALYMKHLLEHQTARPFKN